jgi:hypothetical protein
VYLLPVSPGHLGAASSFFFLQDPEPAGDHVALQFLQVLHFDLKEFLLSPDLLQLLILLRLDRIDRRRLGTRFRRGDRSERRAEHLLFELVVVGTRNPELVRRFRHIQLSHEDLHHDFHPFPVGVLFPLSPRRHELPFPGY